MLRERVLGDSLFDAAFKEYAQRWMFKHPQPADFFRTIEDGAGEQLNYFWRGWFYTTHANDQEHRRRGRRSARTRSSAPRRAGATTCA
jgi:aminopeptidase N